MAKSLRSKRIQANKRVMREKARTIDLQKHDQVVQKLYEQQQSFNMARISTIRKTLYKKSEDNKNAEADISEEVKRKVLGVNKTIKKPKKLAVGPSKTVSSTPSRGVEWLKRPNAPYRPRQYLHHDAPTEKTEKADKTGEDAMVDEDGEKTTTTTDDKNQYNADVAFVDNYQNSKLTMLTHLREICPLPTLYFLSVTDRFLQEEKKAKDYAISHYKTKGNKSVPPQPTETLTEQKKKELLSTASEQDKAAVFTKEEALSHYQRAADGSTMIDDVKVYLPAGYGRFGFQTPENVFAHHLHDSAESVKIAADHKTRYGVLKQQHQKELDDEMTTTRARIKQYKANNKSEFDRTKPLGLLMRERINKMRGDFMNRGPKADHSSLRNFSADNISNLEKNSKSSVGKKFKVQKTIKKKTNQKTKGGKKKPNKQFNRKGKEGKLADAAKHHINKEFAVAMTTRNIMYGKQ